MSPKIHYNQVLLYISQLIALSRKPFYKKKIVTIIQKKDQLGQFYVFPKNLLTVGRGTLEAFFGQKICISVECIQHDIESSKMNKN